MRRHALAATLTALRPRRGCVGRPLVDNPVFIKHDPNVRVANPVFLTLGTTRLRCGSSRRRSTCWTTISRSLAADRYAGLIVTQPKIAPGLEQPWKPGFARHGRTLLATLQSIRYRCEVTIKPTRTATRCSYSCSRNLRTCRDRRSKGPATLRSATTERGPTVRGRTPNVVDNNWVPAGARRIWSKRCSSAHQQTQATGRSACPP